MCGITGVYEYAQALPTLDEALLQKMANAIAHRGPDDSGTYLDPAGRLGLAFRRLAIVDLSPAGHQPMSNEDGTIWIVFNGEIYNHAEHRAALIQKGHVYRSRTDTETIIHLYEEYGDECVHYLSGMFAFCIWDQPRQRLFMARDRIGIKPFYYTQQNGRFIFGSEIKAILAHPAVHPELDEEALYHYLTFMVPPAPLTMFKGIWKLPPGYRMSLDRHGNMKQERYWDAIVPSSKHVHSDEEYAEGVRTLLQASVRTHMMSDVPVGVFLSGGIDSTTNVALMAQCTDLPINTFTVGFKQHQAYNEGHYAREIAKTFKTNHHEILIDYQDALNYIPQLVWSQDEPIADWVCIPLYFVSKLVRDSGVIVVQVGEGSDELFAGYPGYLKSLRRQRVGPYLRWMPKPVWSTATKLSGAVAQQGVAAATQAERIFRRLAVEDGQFWGGAAVFVHPDKEDLLATPFWQAMQKNKRLDSADIVKATYAHFTAQKPDADRLERMIYFELKYRLAELLLMRVDKITMSTSIEARVPFLDHKLIEFALTIPSAVKLRDGKTKAILKKAVQGLIPDKIINRPKQGFNAPISEWLRADMAKEVNFALIQGYLIKDGYLNVGFVQKILADHQNARRDWSGYIWNLYNLEMWYRHYIHGAKA